MLCVVCAASHLRSDALNVRLPGSHAIQIGSAIGRLQLVEFTIPQIPPIVPARVWTPAEIEAELEKDWKYASLQQQLNSLQNRHAEASAANQQEALTRIEVYMQVMFERIEHRRAEFAEILREKTMPRAPWLSTVQLSNSPPPSLVARSANPIGFSFKSNSSGVACELPYWLLFTLASAIGFAPWLRWSRRYSLRTMLVAATVVAVGLGLVVCASR